MLSTVTLFAVMLMSADKKADRFVDQYTKNQRQYRALAEQWTAYCKGKDMIPDITLGCAPAKPAPVVALAPKPEEKPKEAAK